MVYTILLLLLLQQRDEAINPHTIHISSRQHFENSLHGLQIRLANVAMFSKGQHSSSSKACHEGQSILIYVLAHSGLRLAIGPLPPINIKVFTALFSSSIGGDDKLVRSSS
jgi:hypothetical protein